MYEDYYASSPEHCPLATRAGQRRHRSGGRPRRRQAVESGPVRVEPVRSRGLRNRDRTVSLILDALRRKESPDRDVEERIGDSRADTVLATLGYPQRLAAASRSDAEDVRDLRCRRRSVRVRRRCSRAGRHDAIRGAAAGGHAVSTCGPWAPATAAGGRDARLGRPCTGASVARTRGAAARCSHWPVPSASNSRRTTRRWPLRRRRCRSQRRHSVHRPPSLLPVRRRRRRRRHSEPAFPAAHRPVGPSHATAAGPSARAAGRAPPPRLEPPEPAAPQSDHFGLALYYQRIGNFDRALAEYRILLEQNVGSAEVHNNLGLLYQDRGEIDEAVRQFQRAIVDHPETHESAQQPWRRAAPARPARRVGRRVRPGAGRGSA